MGCTRRKNLFKDWGHYGESETAIHPPNKLRGLLAIEINLKNILSFSMLPKQESWRYKRVKKSWRRPSGIDSRMRQKYG